MRETVVNTEEEFAAIAHLRGWCHDMNQCPVCDAYRRGERAAIREIAEG